MKKNKFTEIRNRTAYIRDLLDELEETIKEAELTDDINTKRVVDEGYHIVDATVNDLGEYDLDDDRYKSNSVTKIILWVGIGILIVVYCIFALPKLFFL